MTSTGSASGSLADCYAPRWPARAAMRVEASTISSGSCLRAEVAIAGAGPAGIVTAIALARRGRRVLLLESGASAFDARTQRLGDTAGDDPLHAPMDLGTRRQVGGASDLL